MWTPDKDHALYLWIHLKPTANVKCAAKVAANLPQMVNIVNDPATSVENDEVLAGVGFGAHFYTKVRYGFSKVEFFNVVIFISPVKSSKH